MVTQSSNQSQNIIIKKSVSDFHNSCKERKEITLRNHNGIWKIMRTPVLEFL